MGARSCHVRHELRLNIESRLVELTNLEELEHDRATTALVYKSHLDALSEQASWVRKLEL